ncbi:glutathione S-transferase family protein [uncultured Cohaesibacter sp.]|uniref:glutathione S-transferase family protein n=1 Tax=uncultured Cohaesibacter sp. TaxID=1002546 RepID=UPI0029C8032D|nr:glutathione S-transferase family protein [uncultured Cohaesibacter sp.]
MLKLYHGITSVCSIKVRIGLAEIGLDYEDAVVDLQKGEQHDPDYVRLNPDHVVPTLVDGNRVLVESSLILEYLDKQYNASALMPSEPADEMRARHWLLRCLAVHAAINSLTFSTAQRGAILGAKTPEEIDGMLAAIPDPVARRKRADLLKNGLQSDHVQQALMHLKRTFVDMDRALASGSWIGGAAFGISDIALVPYVDRLERLGFEGLWQDRLPSIGVWLGAMQERASYKTEVVDRIPEALALKQRTSGERYWPELEQYWLDILD